MTTVTSAISSGPYAAAGETTFAVDFQSLSEDEITVTINGVEISNAFYDFDRDDDGTGTVNFIISVTGEVRIYSTPGFDMQIEFERYGAFYPDQINAVADRLARQDLVLSDRIDRSIKFPVNETALELPSAASRLNKYLKFDNAGQPALGDAGGAQGNPGGNVMAIGLFSSAPGLSIPVGTDLVRTSGYSATGAGIAEYFYDAAVDAAYVVANPRNSFLSTNGRGFRIYLGNAPINPDSFGLIQGDNSANGATNSTTFAAMMAAAVVNGASRIQFSSGIFWFADSGAGAGIEVTNRFVIEGAAAAGLGGDQLSVLKFPVGVTGIRIQGPLTSGRLVKDGTAHSSGQGTTLRHLSLKGAFGTSGVEVEAHGVQLRTKATIEFLTIEDFEGDGVHAAAALGAASGANPPYGNINVSKILHTTATGNRNGLYFDGSDANASSVIHCNASSNRQWGIWDSSSLGNQYAGGHVSTNAHVAANTGTTIPASMVTNGTYRYFVIADQEAGASTNAPSGTTADNTWWAYASTAGADPGIPLWVSGISVRAGGAIRDDGVSSYSTYEGVYAEQNQGKAQINQASLVVGGGLPKWLYMNGAAGSTTATSYIDTAASGLIEMGQYVEVSSGPVLTRLGDQLANANLNAFTAVHDTIAPNGFKLKFGGDNYRLTYGNSTVVFEVTGQTTTDQFGTGAAVLNAFYPATFMVGDSRANARLVTNGTVAPTTGAHGRGEIVWNRNMTVGQPIGWACTVAGTPGTWVAMANL